MLEFVNKEIQEDYDVLKWREEELLEELEDIQERIQKIEATAERE